MTTPLLSRISSSGSTVGNDPTRYRMTRRLPSPRLLALIAVICLLAGCGSSSSTTGSSGSSGSGSRTAPAGAGGRSPGGAQFSAKVEVCLKRHGVTLGSGHTGATAGKGSAPKGAAPTGTAGSGSATAGKAAKQRRGGTPPSTGGAAGQPGGLKQSKKLTAALKACGAALPNRAAAGASGPPAAAG
jgi:hypothetical protein